MNDPRSKEWSGGDPWPEPADNTERATLEAGWAALDQLLSQAVPALDAAEVEQLAKRVVWQVCLARRRRRQLLVAAAMLLLGMGASFWVTGLARRADEPAPMIANSGANPRTHESRADDYIAESDTVPEANTVAEADALAWDDAWSDDLADAQQEAADVDLDWRVPMEKWASLRWQMDELEAELNGYAL